MSAVEVVSPGVVPALATVEEYLAYEDAVRTSGHSHRMQAAMLTRALGDVRWRLGNHLANEMGVASLRRTNARVYGGASA